MVTEYDEFSMFADNANEAGLPWRGAPPVRREWVDLPSGKRLSALVWGAGEPELVLLHGGAQNAHTWDTVALALDRPLVAIDLPGHGHSDWRDEHDYWPPSMADDVAVAVGRLAPRAAAVVGMSLGGLTAICLAAQHPHLVRRLGIIDVTPGTDHKKAEGIVAFISGPEYFDRASTRSSRRTIEHNPTRTESSLRRGVLHNARELRRRSLVVALRPGARMEGRRGRQRRGRPSTSRRCGLPSTPSVAPITLVPRRESQHRWSAPRTSWNCNAVSRPRSGAHRRRGRSQHPR